MRTTGPGLRALLIAAALLRAAGPLAAQAAEPRYALLIANGAYSNFSGLSNPVPEARELGRCLERIGFRVTLVTDAGKDAMLEAIADFAAAIAGKKGISFFHYGGHAVQVAGRNYLIPATADIPSEDRVRLRAVDVEEITSIMPPSCTNIIILDSCRNNPLPAGAGRSASRGLSVTSANPSNSIIVYSAQAGSTATDGVFTPILTRKLATEGRSLQELLQEVRKEVFAASGGAQTPGEYSQLFEPVYLNGAPKRAQAATGSLLISTLDSGKLFIDGSFLQDAAKDGRIELKGIPEGLRMLELRYGDEVEKRAVNVVAGQALSIAFTYERNPVFFATVAAPRPGASLRLDGVLLRPDARGVYQVPAGERTLTLEHPLLVSEERKVTAASRQSVSLDWSGARWRRAGLSIADLPPGTRIELKGDNGFAYAWTATAGGPWTAPERPVIGTYAVSLSGPYMDRVATSAALGEDRDLVLSPAIKEFGILSLGSVVPLRARVRSLPESPGDRGLEVALGGQATALRLPAGRYRVIVGKPEDDAPAAASLVELRLRETLRVDLGDPGYSVAWRLAEAERNLAETERIFGTARKTRGARLTTGWVLAGAGALCAGGGLASYLRGTSLYDRYRSSTYSDEAASLRSDAETSSLIASALFSAAAAGALSSLIPFLSAPNPATEEAKVGAARGGVEGLRAEAAALPDYLRPEGWKR